MSDPVSRPASRATDSSEVTASMRILNSVRAASILPPRTQVRFHALDFFRFTAVLLMLEGHVFTALLDPHVKTERWYAHHQFVHGYTAPMFLFASGMAFGFTTFRSWDKFTQTRDGIRKRMTRYFWLIGLGYALHLPSVYPWAFLQMSREQIAELFRVDVLQHIGVSLLVLQLAARLLRKPQNFVGLLSLVFVLELFFAPWIASRFLDQWPRLLSNYVNEQHGSMFPLSPWAIYTHAGVLLAFLVRKTSAPARLLAWPLTLLAIASSVAAVALQRAHFSVFPSHDFWRTSPYVLLFRLGNVLLVFAVWNMLEVVASRSSSAVSKTPLPPTKDQKVLAPTILGRGLATRLRGAAERFGNLVRLVGQESLIVYVGHLLILHGSVINRGLTGLLGETLGLREAVVTTLGLTASMFGLAWLWSKLRRYEQRT